MVTQVDHIELIVDDLEGYVRLFQAMGFKLLSRTTHHGVSVELQLPGPNQPIFELHQVEGEEVIGVNHIAFRVEDMRGVCDALRAQGVRFEGEPRYVKETGRTIVNGRDPDGWRFQIVDAKRRSPA
ncbi:MAG: VOC family protein [Candidatus Methylomirabilia bacterium]